MASGLPQLPLLVFKIKEAIQLILEGQVIYLSSLHMIISVHCFIGASHLVSDSHAHL